MRKTYFQIFLASEIFKNFQKILSRPSKAKNFKLDLLSSCVSNQEKNVNSWSLNKFRIFIYLICLLYMIDKPWIKLRSDDQINQDEWTYFFKILGHILKPKARTQVIDPSHHETKNRFVPRHVPEPRFVPPISVWIQCQIIK